MACLAGVLGDVRCDLLGAQFRVLVAVRGNDDPRLDLAMLSADRQPWRVIVDSNARTPADARVLDDAAPTLLAVADDAQTAHLDGRCELLRIPRTPRGLDLTALLAGLMARNVRGVFLEGGPTLAGSFVAAGLIDRVIAYIAPALLGAGKPGLLDSDIATMDDILRLETLDVEPSGPDIRIIARPRRNV